MRPYARLADNEFEDLIGDLLGQDEDRRYERFRRGADFGIDLRYVKGDEVDVIQCKHYRASGFSKLKTAAKKEIEKLAKLDPVPSRYRFVTSRELTPANKDELVKILGSWVQGPQDVLGGGDVDALLDEHDDVERRHIKLWLAGGTALAALLNADVLNRSRALLERIDRVLPLYVQTEGFLRAYDKLAEEKVCVISGAPGIGKTTLAQMLVADAIKQKFEPIEVSRNIEEAWRVFDPRTPQVFYYDDFLGTTTLGELDKNEDQSLVAFIAAVASRPNALFILTTREYIFKQAHVLYESFERAGIDSRKFLLTIADYGRMERAKILYNHIFHAANLPDEARYDLVEDNGYRRIVDHQLFTPRLIETIIGGYGPQRVEESVDFVDYAVSVLEDPEVIWRRVYEVQLSDRERALLQALVTMPLPAQIGDLRGAYGVLARSRGLGASEADFESSLEVLDDSLVATDLVGGEHVATFINPSVEDFLRGRLAGSPAMIAAVIESARFFDQMRRLWTLFDAEQAEDDLVASIAGRCLGDLFESQAVVWTRVRLEFGRRSLIRAPRNLELRLKFVMELIGCRRGDAFDHLRGVALERLGQLREKWRGGDGVESSALALVEILSGEELLLDLPDGALDDVKALLVAGAVEPGDYQRLIDFRQQFPDHLAVGEMEEIAEQFRAQAEDHLRYSADTLTSEDELQTYGVVAEELGIELDEKLIEEANKEVIRAAEHEEMRFERHEEEQGERYSGHGAEQGEMDGLFGRLID